MPDLIDLRAALERPPRLLPKAPRVAAVAAVFTPSQRLLLMRRAEHQSDPWSGHISFPGGRVEPDDTDAMAAAIRETHEEVGLRLPPSALLGSLDPVAAVGGRPGLQIRPFVFQLQNEEPDLVISEAEVASVHWLELRRLLEGEGRGQMIWRREGHEMQLPCVDFDGQRLWGLTLAMLDGLVERIRQSRTL